MRSMEKKAGLILGGILLFSLVLVGVVMALDNDQVSTSATVTVNEFLDITLGGITPIAFSATDPGSSDNAAGGAVTVTIESTTNVDTDTFLKGSDWSSPVTLDVTNVKYSVFNAVNGSAQLL